MEFLESQKLAYPDLLGYYELFEGLHEKKLWHQLTLALDDFLSKSETLRGNNYIELYKNFIVSFETKLSQVKLALLVSKVSHSFVDPFESLVFLQSVLDSYSKSTKKLTAEAKICIDMDIVWMKLKLSLFLEAKDMLDQTKDILPTVSATETIMFSKFYQSLSEYYKIRGPASDFYKAGLMFLAYTSMDEMTAVRMYELATDMALAALSGENIYNFGEVIATPILATLKGTPNEWLQDLILAINTGNIDRFNVTVDKYQQQYFSQPALSAQHEQIKQKLVLLCLMNIAFERAANDRIISFADIASRARIPIDQVEWVIMRAISLGLIKATMDEIDQNVSVQWIQPRVLEKHQLAVLRGQIDLWTDKVKQALVVTEDQAAELFV